MSSVLMEAQIPIIMPDEQQTATLGNVIQHGGFQGENAASLDAYPAPVEAAPENAAAPEPEAKRSLLSRAADVLLLRTVFGRVDGTRLWIGADMHTKARTSRLQRVAAGLGITAGTILLFQAGRVAGALAHDASANILADGSDSVPTANNPEPSTASIAVQSVQEAVTVVPENSPIQQAQTANGEFVLPADLSAAPEARPFQPFSFEKREGALWFDEERYAKAMGYNLTETEHAKVNQEYLRWLGMTEAQAENLPVGYNAKMAPQNLMQQWLDQAGAVRDHEPNRTTAPAGDFPDGGRASGGGSNNPPTEKDTGQQGEPGNADDIRDITDPNFWRFWERPGGELGEWATNVWNTRVEPEGARIRSDVNKFRFGLPEGADQMYALGLAALVAGSAILSRGGYTWPPQPNAQALAAAEAQRRADAAQQAHQAQQASSPMPAPQLPSVTRKGRTKSGLLGLAGLAASLWGMWQARQANKAAKNNPPTP